jgi:flagellin
MDAANMATGTSGGAAGALTEVAGATAVTAAGTEQKFTFVAEIAAGSATFEVNGNTYTQAFIDGGGTAAESSAATLNALGAKVVAAEANFTSLTADATGLVFTAVTAANTNAGTAKALAAPTAGSGGGVSTNDVLTVAKSLTSVTAIDAALEGVATYRGELGAAANRLEHTVDNLMSRIENVSAARSQIQDTDFATESANLAKAQVLQQAGTAMLAQANATGQGVLSLLK